MAERTAGNKHSQIWGENGPWVLVVDDDIEAGTALARVLEASGYSALCATDCEGARALISVCGFDLIVTDVFMPGMCGLALIEFIRKRGLGIPVVVKADERWRSTFDPKALIQRLGARAMLPAHAAPAVVLEIIAEALPQADAVPMHCGFIQAA
jgi:CheY-like chemotaxis protein